MSVKKTRITKTKQTKKVSPLRVRTPWVKHVNNVTQKLVAKLVSKLGCNCISTFVLDCKNVRCKVKLVKSFQVRASCKLLIDDRTVNISV
jgi:hypothetical protein